MTDVFGSAAAFAWGIIRRLYVLAPTVLLDPADYQARYIQPRFGWSLDLPDWAFPLGLVVGLSLAAFLTYHEARSKAGNPDVVFEVRESHFVLNHCDRSRPEQPFYLADVTLVGQLRNRGDTRADVENVRVALMERGRLWIWREVDKERAAEKLLNSMRAAIDLYHHGVSVEAHSPSKAITEIWAYPSIPVSVTPASKRAYRLRVLVDAYGQRRPTPTYEPVDLAAACRCAQARFEKSRLPHTAAVDS